MDNIKVDKALLNVITPMGLEIKRNSLIIGENTGKVYGIVRYPTKVNFGWLSKITNIAGTVVSISFVPIDNGEFISQLSKSIVMQRGIVESAKDPLTRQRAEKTAQDSERIMLQIDRHGETVGTIIITIMLLAKDDEELGKLSRRVESTIATAKCKPRLLSNLQEQGLKNSTPYYTIEKAVEEVLKRVIPMSSFVGGFPFSSNGYSDGTGYYFGKDSSNGLVILDTWKRGDDRTNTNFTIMGVAGVGKSTIVKSIIISEYMKGTKVIMIDVEREYKDLCENLGGDWINTGGGNNIINPLQISPSNLDDEDRAEEGGVGDLALHMKTLEVFFALYFPSLTDKQKAILKSELIEVYESKGIVWNTNVRGLKNEDFPILKDLYNHIAKKNNQEEYKELELLLRDIAIGSDSFLFNGHSSLTANSNCICLDTFDLQGTGDNIKRTQYFNLMTWAWQQMSKNRDEKVLLICDEAYIMIDPQVPQSLVFLRNIAKRARKYEAGIAIISHSVVDFLDPQIKMYGQALLDIPTYKILMGTDGKNLLELKELYNLTDREEELLQRKKRGDALMIIGSKRLYVNFDIPKYKFEYMGKGGGR